MKREPVRTCIGCGSKKPQRSLLRIAVESGRLVADVRRKLPGRGAYVCGRACATKAVAKRAFARAFKGRAAVADPAALLDALGGAGPVTGFDPRPGTD